ncbi:MAG: sigma-70 family RNA polymerase sigma factor [Acidimicrobiia bacterium]|nr:sigma-70 family RNA polymerase sigma factor [Acidimicrobiia bacterium]
MIDRSGVTDAFRTEWPRLVATLVRETGDLQLAEDVAQEAFFEAAKRWERDGIPDRPGAWLLTTARRKAIDGSRRSKRMRDRLPDLHARSRLDADVSPNQLIDDQLALLLGCCHPAIAPDAQVALTLRIVGGLSTAQIARAFLVSEQTMTRRISRSKAKIRGAHIAFRPVDLETLLDRLPAVCGVIYSIFTEGHASAAHASLVRGDLCDEAVWLAGLLDELVPDDPEVAGLLALVLLVDARRDARIDEDGMPVILADQDRTRWNRAEIDRGLDALSRAHRHGAAGPYQLQAAINALHTSAASFAETDWQGVVALYDALMLRRPTAIVALNRAIAVAEADGAAEGLHAIDAIAEADDLRDDLADYPYLHSSRGELLARLGRPLEAVAAFDCALAACDNDAERAHLRLRRASVAACA